MSEHRWRRRIANLVRRSRGIMRIAYFGIRFVQPKYSIGVTGVVINDKQEILLVEHVFHPSLPWGLPGGWIGHNEDPAQTVQRELKEELGLDVEVDTLLTLQLTEHRHLDIAYLCWPRNEVNHLSFELVSYRWFEENALPRLRPFQATAVQRAHDILKSRAL